MDTAIIKYRNGDERTIKDSSVEEFCKWFKETEDLAAWMTLMLDTGNTLAINLNEVVDIYFE